MQIPHHLWQTWKHPHPPTLLKRCISSFHKLNPTWEIHLHTDEDIHTLIDTEFPELREVIDLYPRGVYLADIWRCLVLYKHGGIYADIDIECIRPLDELITAAIENGYATENTELLLTRDHPVHENHHFEGREMYMNHFIVAKPNATFFKKAIDRLVTIATEHPEKLTAGPISLTGPGLFSSIIKDTEGLAKLNIGILPWQWIHPLPNMAIPAAFPKKEYYDELIRSGRWSWELNPFVAHYWWHNYHESCNMLTEYGDTLFQSDGLIVSQRLETLISESDTSAHIPAYALAELAELNEQLLFDPSLKNDGNPSQFEQWTSKVFQNLPFRLCSTLDELHRDPRELIGLLRLSPSTGGQDQCFQVLKTILAENLIAPNGFILLDPLSPNDNFFNAARKAILSKGFTLLEEGPQLLFRQPDPTATITIPKVIHQTWKNHDIPDIFRKEWIDSWMELNGPNGWEYRFWTDEDLLHLIEEDYPDFLDCYFDYDLPIKRVDAARYFIMKSHGGLYADLDFACLKPIDELLVGNSLLFGTEHEDSTLPGAICNALMASTPNHPFWTGIDNDLRSHASQEVLDATGPCFLSRRLATCPLFLRKEHFPTVTRKQVFYPFRWNDEIKATVKKQSLRELSLLYPDSYAVTFWTGTWL